MQWIFGFGLERAIIARLSETLKNVWARLAGGISSMQL
jgi:hypothetical protein